MISLSRNVCDPRLDRRNTTNSDIEIISKPDNNHVMYSNNNNMNQINNNNNIVNSPPGYSPNNNNNGYAPIYPFQAGWIFRFFWFFFKLNFHST